jgi:pimeloyl-ACP methyl ester carboxylesterase
MIALCSDGERVRFTAPVLQVFVIKRPRRWLLLAVLLMVSAAASAAPGDAIYAHPGRLVSVSDGARLNFICMGVGSPAVIFESTFDDWAPVWALVLPGVASRTQACVYEHAGAGFSEPGPMPRTNVRLATELDQALHNAGISGPYILVGNASGGQPARTFAQMYMAETAGLVLLEPDVTDLEPKAMQDEDHAGNTRGIAALRKCRDAAAAGTPHLEPGCAGFFFRGLPEPQFSPELNAALLKILESKVAAYDAALGEWEQLPQTEAWLQRHSQSLGFRPVRVLSTGNHAVHFLPAANAHDPKHLEYEHQIALAQARLLTLSANTKQIFVPNSSEYVQFDAPDAVVDAIREVYDQSREGKPDR